MESESLNLQRITPKKVKSSDYEMGRTLGTGIYLSKFLIIYLTLIIKYLNNISRFLW